MKKSVVLLAVSAAATEVTPIQKVLTMMEDMVKNAKAAKHAEEVEFASFQQWCDSVRGEKTKNIAEGAASIEQLDADIAKAESDAQVLGEEIAALQASIAQMNAEAASAKAIRDKEHADYSAEHEDLSESIDACQRAHQVLKSRGADVPQSLLQLKNTVRLSTHEQGIIDSFLGMGQAPLANAYEFQSGSVVELLEKLTMKFQDERLALEKAELAAKGNYEVLMQRLHDNTEASQESEGEKTAAKAQRIEDKAGGEADLSLTTKVKGEDEKGLSDTLSECHSKAASFEKDQVTRAEEVKALEKAIEIIGSEDVQGAGEKHLPQMVQVRKQLFSLAQLRSQSAGGAQTQAAAILKAAAARIGSRYLAVMAAHVADDPFIKVKQMIKDLITKLMEEANEEADHHSYCTSELATNKQTRENKATETEALTAEVEKLTAQAAQLASFISKTGNDISDILASQAEATTLRNEEKAVNAKTVAEAQAAQEAVEKATKVLRDFYAKAAEASFVQTQGKEPYGGQQDSSSGIFGMLEVILSDFARLESETSSAEDQAASSYKTFMNESTEDKEVKEVEKEHKEGNKRRTEEQLLSSKKQLGQTQEELDAANDYYAKLKADCLDTGLSYEERKARRQEEIVSLQEAMKMLESGI